jgi:type VI secretion system protein ImpC
MPGVDTFAAVEIETEEEPRLLAAAEPELPFRILVLGDFTGGVGRNRAVIEIDRDRFNEVLALFSPEARVAICEEPLAIRFRALEDFHPDRLFDSLAPFAALRDLRRRLSDPATFASAAAQIAPARATVPASEWDRMLREMVEPYAAPRAAPRQAELIAQAEAAMSGHMCAILHHPAFRAIEAAWRGVHFLVRRLETGRRLRIYVLDVGKEELLSGAGLAALRYELSAEDWAVVAGLYEFAPPDEPALLRIASLARAARAPFLAGLAPEAAGVAGIFSELRLAADAPSIGLASPRFLLRLPYGSEADQTASFAFEEMPSPPEHKRYLWGNPAIACAFLLGDAFTRYGWNLNPGASQTIEGLPLHVSKIDGVPEPTPCAEVLLTEDAAEALLDRGFIPLASIKGTGSIRVVRFQSVANPSTPLAGRW